MRSSPKAEPLRVVLSLDGIGLIATTWHGRSSPVLLVCVEKCSSASVLDWKGKALQYGDEGVYVAVLHRNQSPRWAVGALTSGNYDWLKLVSVDGEEAKYIARHCIWGGEKGNEVREGDLVHLISTGMNWPGWNIWTGAYNGIWLNNEWTNNDKMTIVKKGDAGYEYILKFLHNPHDGSAPPSYVKEALEKDDWLYVTSNLEEAMSVQFVRLDMDINKTPAGGPPIPKVVLDSDGKALHYRDWVYIIESRSCEEDPMKSVGTVRSGNDDWMKLLLVDGGEGKYVAKHQFWDKVKGEEAEVQDGNFLHFISEGTNWPGCNIWTGHYSGVKITQWYSENDRIVIEKHEGSSDNKYILKVYCNPGYVSPRIMDCFYVVVKGGSLRLSSYSHDALVVQFARQLALQAMGGLESTEAIPNLKAAERLLDWNDNPIRYGDHFYLVKVGTREKGPILAAGLSKDRHYNYPKLLSVDSDEKRYIAKQYMTSLEGKKRGDEVHCERDLLRLISRGINWAGWNIWTSYYWGVRLYLESRLESDGYKHNHQIRIFKKGQHEYFFKMYCVQPGFHSPKAIEWYFVATNGNGSLYLTTFSDDAMIVEFAPQLPTF
eukprot:Gb_34619 [translate_table: standard]